MRITLALLLTLPTGLAAAPAQTASSGPAPVIGCASLANLRAVLRTQATDPAAALALIKDPKADLGCATIDRAAVTDIADHVALGGQAYECVGLQTSRICHWTIAGAVVPAARNAGSKPPSAAPPEKVSGGRR